MKKKLELLIILLLFFAAVFTSHQVSKSVVGEAVEEDEVDVVVLDAGHGATDPGKVGVNGELEKDVNLAIAKKVQVYLEAEGVQVVMTREDDEPLYEAGVSNKKLADMQKRVTLINETKPSLAVSIHQNSYQDSDVAGAQVFYYKNSQVGEAVAGVMQEELRAVDTNNHRQIKPNDTYYMLKKTEVPTIIVECGFLSNPTEAEKLTDEAYQEEIARAICNGVIKWLAK